MQKGLCTVLPTGSRHERNISNSCRSARSIRGLDPDRRSGDTHRHQTAVE
jgi:hypothetical protein